MTIKYITLNYYRLPNQKKGLF